MSENIKVNVTTDIWGTLAFIAICILIGNWLGWIAVPGWIITLAWIVMIPTLIGLVIILALVILLIIKALLD